MSFKSSLKKIPFLQPAVWMVRSLRNLFYVWLGLDGNAVAAQYKKIAEATNTKDTTVDGYGEERAEIEKVRIQLKDYLLSQIQAHSSSGSVLDYGCGSGVQLEALSSLGTYQLVGVDQSEETLNKFTRQRKIKGELLQAALDRENNFVDSHTNSFDVVYSMGVLQHVNPSNLTPLFKSFATILKPGGGLFLYFAHPNSWLSCIRNLDYVRYPPRIVEARLKKQGLTIAHSGTFPDGTPVRYLDTSGRPNQGYWIHAKKPSV